MPANTPEEAHELFSQLFETGDLDELMSLYEPDAVMLPEPGKPVSGSIAIREALQAFLSLRGKFDLRVQRVIEAGDIAMIFSSWTLNGTGPDGTAIALKGQTSDVVRLQDDGTWLFVIDNPYGCVGVES
jgi:uncharacterized protein (TIGR02246 family)